MNFLQSKASGCSSRDGLQSRMAARLMQGASAGVIALLTVTTGAVAQQADENTETVTVTGTLIKGIAPVGTNRITFDSSQIDATGAVTTNQVLSNIPQITNAFNTTAQSPIGATGGGYNPTIRNIAHAGGGTTTLTLIDGHNFIGVGGLQTAPDPGYIPTVVLQRVDVVPDGGSALYGANALTGVINFITRDSFEGVQVDANGGFADSYSSFNTSAIAGHSWGSGSMYIAAQYRTNSYLMQNARSYNRQDLTGIGGRDTRLATCPQANITVTSSQQYRLTSNPADVAGSVAASAQGPFGAVNSFNVNGVNRCDTTAFTSMVPKEEQESIFGSFRQQIAKGVEFDMKFLWGTRLTTALQNTMVASGVINNTNPFFQPIGTETQQTVAFDFSPAQSGHSALPVFSSVSIASVTPEVTVDLWDDWDLKLLGNWGRSALYGQSRSVNTTALNNALRQQPGGPTLSKVGQAANAIDPYNVALTNQSVIQDILNYGTGARTVQSLGQARGMIDGSLFELPGGAVKVVVGGQYSIDTYNGTWITGPVRQTYGPTIPGGTFANGQKTRYTKSVFGEIYVPIVGQENRMPLVHSLSIDVSGRYDDYSDFGGTSNPKIGFTYEPFEDLSIRGNMGTSFDAPSLADITAPDGRLQMTTYTTPNTLVPPGTSAADALRPSVLVPGGNPNLSPEKASTWSIGADFHPHELFGVDFTGLDLGITAWHVGEHNQIGLAPYQAATISQGFSIPAYSKFYIFNPTQAQLDSFGYTTLIGFPGPTTASAYAPGVATPYIVYDARRNNLGNEFLDGLDFHFAYVRDVDFGTVSVGVDGTYTLGNDIQGAAGQPLKSNQAYNTPLYQATAYIGLTAGALSGKLTMNYSPSYALDPATNISRTLYGQVRVGSFSPVNLFVSYDLSGLYSWTDGASANITINNIADEDPPILLGGNGANSTAPNSGNGLTLGRYVEFGLRKKF